MRESKTLPHDSAKRFYDRVGKLQDTQGFYEDQAVKAMVAHGGFDEARAIFELGCGTGRHAANILNRHPTRYLGVDVSETMVNLARSRLDHLPDAAVRLIDGKPRFPFAGDAGFDRFISTYVLDLMSADDITTSIAEAARLLDADGRLCLVSLHDSRGGLSGAVCAAWRAVHRLSPKILGGCRPLSLVPHVESDGHFIVEHSEVITNFGVPSEVLIARRGPLPR